MHVAVRGFSRFIYFCAQLAFHQPEPRSPTAYFVSLYSPPPLPFLSYTMPNPPVNWQRASQLESLITRATTAAQPENNYALHIEIAEHINKKKANTYISFS
jgi:hypothetical protein